MGRLGADRTIPEGDARMHMGRLRPHDTTYVAVSAASLHHAQTWRSQYERAKTLAAQRGSPPGDPNSATGTAA